MRECYSFDAACVVIGLRRVDLQRLVQRRWLVGRVLNPFGDHVFSRDELMEFCIVWGRSTRRLEQRK